MVKFTRNREIQQISDFSEERNMVREIIKGGKRIFICEECGLGYSEINVAQKCEDYCSKHHACSLEITKNAVYKPKQPRKP